MVEIIRMQKERPTLGYHLLFKSSYFPLKKISLMIGILVSSKFEFISNSRIAILMKIAMKSFLNIDSVSCVRLL